VFDSNSVPVTDVSALIRLRDSAYAVDMFVAGLTWLDLFTKLAEQPRSLEEICRDLDVVERPASALMHLVEAWGLVRVEDGRYVPTEIARRHLVRGTPESLVPYFASLKERPTVRDTLDVLRYSNTSVWRERREQDKAKWSELMQRSDFAEFYTAGMDSRGSILGPALAEIIDLSGRKRLLDVAGGSGIYAANVVRRHPHIEASVLERPPVDDAARKLLERQGFGGRIGVIGADMFADPLPRGFDVHLYSHILHDWPLPKVRELVAKSFNALEPGGMIAIYSAHMGEEHGPPAVAEYSVLMMYLYEGRCYAVPEMEQVLTEAGFRDVRFTPSPVGSRSLITANKPPHA
jgi:hypothetical protein